MANLIETLDLYFGKKAPQLPASFREFIVKVAPYVVLIVLIFTAITIVPLILVYAGISILAAATGNLNFGGFVSLIGGIASSIIMLIALPGLFSRNSKGWTFTLYAQLLLAVIFVLTLNIFGIVGSIISFWLLFQIKPYYFGLALGQAPAVSVPSTPAPTPAQPATSVTPVTPVTPPTSEPQAPVPPTTPAA